MHSFNTVIPRNLIKQSRIFKNEDIERSIENEAVNNKFQIENIIKNIRTENSIRFQMTGWTN